MATATLRPELTALPRRLRNLPVDARGYPVPWFVQWLDRDQRPVPPRTPEAAPDFRLMDRDKWVRAVREGRCWTCGDLLGTYKTFVVGPMCGINRTTAEPASHLECAEWSARNCPFLSRPRMVRRDSDALAQAARDHVAGFMLDRNPGVALLWTTKSFQIWRDHRGQPLITIGEPTGVAWYAEGRAATRAEVEASVTSGLPALQQMADTEEGDDRRAEARHELARRRRALEALYPAEATP